MSWYRPQKGDKITVDEVIARYVENGDKADGTWLVLTESLRPFIEYHWNKEKHRGGAVPLRSKNDEWDSLVYGHWDHERKIRGMSRWEYLKNYMSKHGWKKDPGYVDIDKQGRANLVEGNHRVNLALELGIEYVPISFNYVARVTKSKAAF